MKSNIHSINYFKQYDFLEQRDQEKLLELVQFVRVPQNKILLHRGEHIRQVGVVIEGLIRVYDKNNNTVWLVAENGIYGSMDTLALDRSSSLTYETIEETTMFLLNYEELEKSLADFPNIAKLLLNYWKLTAIQIYGNFCTFLHLSPIDRYLYLLENHPKLILRVKSQDLATYLGMHPASLSRLKKRHFTS